MARQQEEFAHKDELFQQIKDELTNDDVDSYAAGFEDVIVQVAYVHPEVDLSHTGLTKTVVDGQLVDV